MAAIEYEFALFDIFRSLFIAYIVHTYLVYILNLTLQLSTGLIARSVVHSPLNWLVREGLWIDSINSMAFFDLYVSI